MDTVIDFRLKLIAKLHGKCDQTLKELESMSLKELRNLHDETFPRKIEIISVSASGGVSKKFHTIQVKKVA